MRGAGEMLRGSFSTREPTPFTQETIAGRPDMPGVLLNLQVFAPETLAVSLTFPPGLAIDEGDATKDLIVGDEEAPAAVGRPIATVTAAMPIVARRVARDVSFVRIVDPPAFATCTGTLRIVCLLR